MNEVLHNNAAVETHEKSQEGGLNESAAAQAHFLQTFDAFHGHEERLRGVLEAVRAQAANWARICIATTALAGCAGVPKSAPVEAGVHEGVPATSSWQQLRGVGGEQSGVMRSAVIEQVRAALPASQEEVVEYAVHNALGTAAKLGGLPGMAALEVIEAAKIHHNAECAERAATQLEEAIVRGGGTVLHEGTDVRGEFAVSIVPKEEWGDVLQGVSIEEWGPQYNRNQAQPAWLKGAQAVTSPLGAFAEQAYTSEAREADAFFRYTKEFEVGHTRGEYQGAAVVVEVRYIKQLPVEVPEYVGGVE